MLLLYFFSYMESKVGNATFLKLNQEIPVPAIHTRFAWQKGTASIMLSTVFHFARSLHE